ncbi:MAG: hypothetical protein IT373_31885 [Polyangiaceae bacterium]|nr:hypothetical protein [Polyangiaceae bacterium]
MGRRQLFRACAAGLVGTTLPAVAMTPGCDRAAEILEPLLAKILQYTLDKLTYTMAEAINNQFGGVIALENHENDEQTGIIDMETLLGDSVVDGASGPYTVPAGVVQQYAWSGLSAPAAGDYMCRGISALNQMLTDVFSVA